MEGMKGTYIEVGIEFTVELLVEKIEQALVLITCKMDDSLLLFVVDVQKAYLIAKSREFNGLLENTFFAFTEGYL